MTAVQRWGARELELHVVVFENGAAALHDPPQWTRRWGGRRITKSLYSRYANFQVRKYTTIPPGAWSTFDIVKQNLIWRVGMTRGDAPSMSEFLKDPCYGKGRFMISLSPLPPFLCCLCVTNWLCLSLLSCPYHFTDFSWAFSGRPNLFSLLTLSIPCVRFDLRCPSLRSKCESLGKGGRLLGLRIFRVLTSGYWCNSFESLN